MSLTVLLLQYDKPYKNFVISNRNPLGFSLLECLEVFLFKLKS